MLPESNTCHNLWPLYTPFHTETKRKQTMTKKHFEALADSIRCIMDPHARLQAAVAVAHAVGKFNPRFDYDQFYKAAGVVFTSVEG